LKRKDNLEAAIREFTRAVETDPKCADAYEWRGLALRCKKDFSGAIKDYNKLLSVAAWLPGAREEIIQLVEDLKRLKK
jgi:Flp pilus assembly protein TadD